MSDKRDGKKPEDIAYPPKAYIRTPRHPGVPVEYPDSKRKQQPDSDDKSKLDWLVEADKYEAPANPSKGAQTAQKSKGEAKKPAPTGSSLDWLREADHYEPPKENSKINSKK